MTSGCRFASENKLKYYLSVEPPWLSSGHHSNQRYRMGSAAAIQAPLTIHETDHVLSWHTLPQQQQQQRYRMQNSGNRHPTPDRQRRHRLQQQQAITTTAAAAWEAEKDTGIPGNHYIHEGKSYDPNIFFQSELRGVPSESRTPLHFSPGARHSHRDNQEGCCGSSHRLHGMIQQFPAIATHMKDGHGGVHIDHDWARNAPEDKVVPKTIRAAATTPTAPFHLVDPAATLSSSQRRYDDGSSSGGGESSGVFRQQSRHSHHHDERSHHHYDSHNRNVDRNITEGDFAPQPTYDASTVFTGGSIAVNDDKGYRRYACNAGGIHADDQQLLSDDPQRHFSRRGA